MSWEIEQTADTNVSAKNPGVGIYQPGEEVTAADMVNGDGSGKKKRKKTKKVQEIVEESSEEVAIDESTTSTTSTTSTPPAEEMAVVDAQAAEADSEHDESLTVTGDGSADYVSQEEVVADIDESEQRRLAEVVHENDIAEAKEIHTNLSITRSDLEAELKDIKADEKSALRKLKSIIDRGPNYPTKISKIDHAVASADKSAIQVDDHEADDSWKQIKTADIIQGIEGMGEKKEEAIIALAPTLGDIEELRAKASVSHQEFHKVLPKGVGSRLADEIEERAIAAVAKHCLAMQKNEERNEEEAEKEEVDGVEYEDVEDVEDDQPGEEAAQPSPSSLDEV